MTKPIGVTAIAKVRECGVMHPTLFGEPRGPSTPDLLCAVMTCVPRTWMTKAEAFFLGQIAETLGDEPVVASGYFRTFMKDRSGSGTVGKLGAFGDAARARGYFLALTESAITIVETRAPATSAPLLENTGTASLSLSEVTGVSMTPELLLIESPSKTLPLQMTTKNKAFPQQGGLVNALAKRFNLPDSVESIQAAQRQGLLKKLALIIIVVVIAIAWAVLK